MIASSRVEQAPGARGVQMFLPKPRQTELLSACESPRWPQSAPKCHLLPCLQSGTGGPTNAFWLYSVPIIPPFPSHHTEPSPASEHSDLTAAPHTPWTSLTHNASCSQPSSHPISPLPPSHFLLAPPCPHNTPVPPYPTSLYPRGPPPHKSPLVSMTLHLYSHGPQEPVLLKIPPKQF